ncbi:MAG TPA: DUF1553 domain-containing protein [Tepidisphaeraceae bacterium]|jgi:hypothetical protein
MDPWNHPPIWHAINVHLPIALAYLGLPLVCWLAITRGRSMQLRWFAVVFYAVFTGAAAFAMITGEDALGELNFSLLSQHARDQIRLHQTLANKVWIFAAVTAVLLLLGNLPRRWARQTFLTLATVVAVTSAGWMVVVGHTGGVSVYEEGMGTVAMQWKPKESGGTRLASAATTAPAGAVLIAPTTAPGSTVVVTTQPITVATVVAPGMLPPVSYDKDIRPIMESKCDNCHSEGDEKGEYNTTSVATMAKAGESGIPGIVPGHPEKSALVLYITGEKTPRMPKKKPPLPDAQIAMIKRWVAEGAKDDSEGATQTAAQPEKKEQAQGKPASPPTPKAAVNEKSPVSSAITATTENKPSPPTSPGGPGEGGAQAKSQPASAPSTQAAAVSPAWDPDVPWSAAEAAAVRRFERLKYLPKAPAVPKVSAPTTNPIDNFIAARWEAQAASAKATTQPKVPDVCDDSTFVRRAYLDVVGFIPSATEARKFIEDKDPQKRAKLIDALLSRNEQYAQNWAPFWEDALCSNGLHQGGVGTHGNYRKWLLDSFRTNKPYDLMVQELLDPKEPEHPVRYVLNDTHDRTVQSAADTAQVFLGTAIKCASCHNHFQNDEWPQARAVAFAGYFQQKDMEIVRCERGTGKFVQTHFMFDLPHMPADAPTSQPSRMKQVAQMITDPNNPRFAKTLVNRLWKRYMGLGMFEPADDFRMDIAPSHPELLDWLANDFIRHGYNLKHTIRLILTSRTYQLKFDPKLADKFDVEKPGEQRYFRSPQLRRLTEEQLLDSIHIAVNQRELGGDRAFANDSSTPLTRSLGRPPTRNEVQTARPDDTAVVQSLELLNGQEYHDRVYKGSQIASMSVTTQPSKIVEDMYWNAYGRKPSEKEMEVSTQYLKGAPRPATTQPVEIVFLDDSIPPGATQQGKWTFAPATAQPVFSGKTSHTDGETEPVPTQHLFHGTRFDVNPTDVLFTYVYLDPQTLPQEIMLQFHANGDWRRAFWGADAIPFKPSVNMGALPKAGAWVRLEVPASKVGIDKPTTLAGVSFDQMLGKVYWDKTGITKGPAAVDPETIGDMIWALLTSPEFQYIR